MIRKNALKLGLIFIFAGMLTACSQQAALPPESEYPETTVTETAAVPTEETAPALAEATLEELEALLGMEDSQAAEHFAGGEENWTADKSFLIGRIYHVSLWDRPVNVYTNYSDDSKVVSVSAWLTDGTWEVTEDDVQTWIQKIDDYTGSDPVYDGTTSEAGSKNWKWKHDDTFITLHWLGDIVTVEFQPAVGELH